MAPDNKSILWSRATLQPSKLHSTWRRPGGRSCPCLKASCPWVCDAPLSAANIFVQPSENCKEMYMGLITLSFRTILSIRTDCWETVTHITTWSHCCCCCCCFFPLLLFLFFFFLFRLQDKCAFMLISSWNPKICGRIRIYK